MGFSNVDRKQYVRIFNGKFAIRVPKGTPGSMTRINKENKEVTEIYHDRFTGHLTFFDVQQSKDKKYGNELVIQMTDNDRQYVITVPFSSRYCTSFLNCIHNIDPQQPLTIAPWRMEKSEAPGTFVSGWTMYQGERGEIKIAPKYPKDSKELPKLEQVRVKGNLVWDDTKQMDFLWNQALDWGVMHGFFSPPVEESEPDAF